MEWPLFIERFREIVERNGLRPAIVDRGQIALTYDQLWRLSGRVASRLAASQIGRECVVGLALPKSPEMIAAIIGCWRARAAYVPLDPNLPADRLRRMTEDAEVSLMITDPQSAGDFPRWAGGKEIGKWSECSACEPSELKLIGQPHDLAWVIFTSGTTGRPRGVQVEHRGFVNVLDAQRAAFGIDETSRVLLLYSTSFDASLSDIGTALLSGAALCLEDADSVSSCGSIVKLIRDRRISHADIPPSMLALHVSDEAPECLETVIIGGEVCPPEVVRRWANRVRLINVYGPTEATICTSLGECSPDWSRPLLGQPLPEIEYRIDNGDNQPADPCQAGELLISGPCLARGYANCADVTARKFVVLDGQRFYRTGDRVRLDGDGEYVFLGRLDRQLKVRGFRIEAEEIETAVRKVDGVAQCAVVQRLIAKGPGKKHVVAFVEGDRDLTASRLREELRETIPAPVIPTRFEFISAIPRTVSGKPDLETLERIELAESEPQTEGESELLSIVRSAIGIPSLKPDEDIFDAGADSLSVLAIAATAQSHGYSLQPHTIARERTVNRLLAVNTFEPDMRTAGWLRDDAKSLQIELKDDVTSAAQGVPQLTLLTGATGFLGSRVLREWLTSFNGRVVVCLVRAEDDQDASDRLDQTLRHHEIVLTSSQRNRVEAIAGDLCQSDFGWDRDRWTTLAQQVDTVVHLAAAVHVFAPYEQLRPANVSGTASVLRFSLDQRIKRLHYASTLSVFVGTDRNSGVAVESDDLSQTKRVYGGYAQTKWAAEVLLRSAPDPLPLDIYRFGLLTGDAMSRCFPEHDLFAMTVRGLARMRCVPVGADHLEVDITPVDFAARSMVEITRDRMKSADPGVHQKAWHIANPKSLSSRDLFESLIDICPNLERVSNDEFLRRVSSCTEVDPGAACLSLCRWLSEADSDQARPLDLFQATGMTFDMTETQQVLTRTGIHCPAPDRSLIRHYIGGILSQVELQSIQA